MAEEVLVIRDLNSNIYLDIDFNDAQWSSLLPENINEFKLQETLRPCHPYKDGIFPGNKKYKENKQITTIRNFSNYVEYSKIISDEVVPIKGQLYLTTKFYDRRKIGWESKEVMKKGEGEILGYVVNGNIYHVHDIDFINSVFYGIVYKSLVSDNEVFINLLNNKSTNLTLKNANIEFMNYFKKLIEED